MFAKPGFLVFVIQVALLLHNTEARIWILERDGRAIFARKFGQAQPEVLAEIRAACSGGICDTLAGKAITPLLAAQPECSQQDMADEIIDTSRQFDTATQAKMIAAAVKYRQAEKNTPPDFTINPPALRNSVFCQKAPNNSELNGLSQAQDPANDPELFFDPAKGATVKRRSQPNTVPFGSNTTNVSQPPTNDTSVNNGTTNGGGNLMNSGSNNSTNDTGNIGDFGSCSVPKIEFGQGFDGRRETAFRPTDMNSYPHGSAQNIDVITQFMCDELVNTCKADATARNTCAKAKAAASSATPVKTGIQADAFNAIFGIITEFAKDPVFDDTGNIISENPNNGTNNNGDNNNNGSNNTNGGGTNANGGNTNNTGGNNGNNVTCTPTNGGSNNNTNTNGSGSSGNNGTAAGNIGNFGSCSIPEIEFGVGFDGRRETSFQPVDKVSYNHGSAQNIDIISQFVCDQLVNKCGADSTARATCAQARTAATNAPAKTGKQADAFNAGFGKVTNFASVTPLDDQGRPVVAARSFLRRRALRVLKRIESYLEDA